MDLFLRKTNSFCVISQFSQPGKICYQEKYHAMYSRNLFYFVIAFFARQWQQTMPNEMRDE